MQEEIEALTFEAALAALEETVTALEEGDLPLEEALVLFERGQLLAAHCDRQLNEASLRVEQLTEHGELAEVEVA